MPMFSLVGNGTPLTDQGLDKACALTGLSRQHLWAVFFVETDPPNGGYLHDRRPQILYESHIFGDLTGHIYDARYPDLSTRKEKQHYGTYADQYRFLLQACGLNQDAALQSCSWGLGQTLGKNFKEAGYQTVADLVIAMVASEDDQAIAVAHEMNATQATEALRSNDWKTFARRYNGSDYARNQYDTKIASQFARLDGHLPDLKIRTAQCCLYYDGFSPGIIDGIWGDGTIRAWHRFQESRKITLTNTLDQATYDLLTKPYVRPTTARQLRTQQRQGKVRATG